MTDDTPDYATLKALFVAVRCLRSHSLPDSRHFALFVALLGYIDGDGICWPSTRTLATMARISRPHVLKLLNEFAHCGLIEFIDPPKKGRQPRRLRVHCERLTDYAVVNHALPQATSKMVNAGLTIKNDEMVNAGLTIQKPEMVNVPQPKENGEMVNLKALNGQPYVDLKRKQEEWLTPKGDSDACGPPVPEKSDVRRKAAPPSNDAVKKKAVVDRKRLNTTTYARARRT